MKVITSRENPFVKQLIALAHSSRERKKARLTVLDGIHLVQAYTDALGAVHALAVAESALNEPEVRALISRHDDRHINVLAEPLMAQASSLDSPATVLALVATPDASPTPSNASAVLVLEDVQDPGNVGSMLRSAAAAGVREVVLSNTCAFAWSPKVLRAGQGAHFILNINEGVDLVLWLKTFQGQALALVPKASATATTTATTTPSTTALMTLYKCDLQQSTALLIGNEGSGLSPELIDAASIKATIPMPGQIESLNAAACAAIALFEMVRQRGCV